MPGITEDRSKVQIKAQKTETITIPACIILCPKICSCAYGMRSQHFCVGLSVSARMHACIRVCGLGFCVYSNMQQQRQKHAGVPCFAFLF